MNKQTSNDMMEREFDILQSIQRLEPPAHVYEHIMSRTGQEIMTVSKKWFAGAAALLAVLICIEVFLVNQQNSASSFNEVETLVHQENHQLYE